MRVGWQARVGPAALILLTHLVFFAVVIRYAGMPSSREEGQAATYIRFALIPDRAKPRPAKALAAEPPPAACERKPTLRREAPVAPVATHVPAAPAPTAEAEAPAPQVATLDMEALRSAARRADRERATTALERQRESEQLRSEDDSALARGIQRAKRPNCQTAYSGGEKLNLIMLIPLALDTIRDKGCKW